MKTQMINKNEIFKNYKLNFFTDRRLKNYRKPIVTTNISKEEK